jgi:trans-aconitate 2-methyltransferase
MTDSKEISRFYDQWVPTQVRVGVNLRHRTIVRLLKREGLRRSDRVLEIGCGVGTVTGLVAAYLRSGRITAVDISPTSIDEARRRLSRFKHVEFVVSDMSDFAAPEKFDAVFLPDVLEHIPVEQHLALFRTLRGVIKDSGFVLIHIPNPRYQDWLRTTHPEKLQIIDQALHTYPLLRDVYESGFYLHRLSSHSVFHEISDYQALTLRVNQPLARAEPIGKHALRLKNLYARLFY